MASKTIERLILSDTTVAFMPPASKVALAPRFVDGHSGDSKVAIGTLISSEISSLIIFIGPTNSNGIIAV